MARILVVERVAPAGLEMLAARHETERPAEPGAPRACWPPSPRRGLGCPGGALADARRRRAARRGGAPPLAWWRSPRSAPIGSTWPRRPRRTSTVINAPTGSTVAAAEHTMALLLALLRRIPSADASVRRGEWERARYLGRRAAAPDAGDHRPRARSARRSPERARSVRDAGDRARPVSSPPGQVPEHVSALVELPEPAGRRRRRHRPRHADAADARADRSGADRGDEARAPCCVNVARGGLIDEAALAARPRRAATCRAPPSTSSRPSRWRADNPLRGRTQHDPHPAPGCVDRGGPGSRRASRWPSRCSWRLSGVTPPYAVERPVAWRCDVAPEAASARRARAAAGDPGAAGGALPLRHRGDHLCRRDRRLGWWADPHRHPWRDSSRRSPTSA